MVSLLYTEVMKLHFEYDATAPNNLRWVWLSYKAWRSKYDKLYTFQQNKQDNQSNEYLLIVEKCINKIMTWSSEHYEIIN